MSESTDDLDEIRERRKRELLERVESGASGPGRPDSPGRPIVVEGPDHLDELRSTHPRLLVDFHAEWCGPCHMLAPTIERLAEDAPTAVAKVDIDRRPDLARQFGVRSVPTLVFFVDGEPDTRLVGLQDEGTLRDLVQRHV